MGTQLLTGERIIEYFFQKYKDRNDHFRNLPGGPLGLDLDIETDWFNISDQRLLIEAQPFWFKYLIDRHNKFEEHRVVDGTNRESSQVVRASSVRDKEAGNTPKNEQNEQLFISM